MPTYEITAPNGKVYEVEGEGTKEQALAHFVENWKPEGVKNLQPTQEQPQNLTAYQSFLKGLSEPVLPKGRTPIAGAALAGLGGETLKNIGAVTQLVSPTIGTPIVETGEAMIKGADTVSPTATTVGQVGSYALPMNALTKGARLLTSVPKTLLGNVAEQGLIGGTTGFLTTPGEAKDRIEETALNAVVGGGMPVVGRVLGAAKSLAEPLYEKGREQILGRFLRESAGKDADKAVANMKAAEEIIPGSSPTVGQVAGVPSLSALERSAMATGTPEATNIIAARKAAQNQARVEALQNITTPTRVSKYDALRERVGNDLYEPALSVKMDFANLTPEMQKEVGSLVKTPAIKKAMGEARQNALNRGVDINDPSGSLRGLHETKIALDDKIASVKANLEKNGKSTSGELEGLQAAKTRLLGFIEDVSPEYKTARETYARLSKPIEQLNAIEKLSKKAISSDADKVHINAFFNELNKVKDQGILSKQQLARLEAVGEDLKRTKYVENQGRGVGSDTAQKLSYGNMLNQLGIPSGVRQLPAGQVIGSIASRIGQPIYGGAEQQMKTRLAELLMNPQEAANLMQNAKFNTNKGVPLAENLAKMLMLQQSTQGEK